MRIARPDALARGPARVAPKQPAFGHAAPDAVPSPGPEAWEAVLPADNPKYAEARAIVAEVRRSAEILGPKKGAEKPLMSAKKLLELATALKTMRDNPDRYAELSFHDGVAGTHTVLLYVPDDPWDRRPASERWAFHRPSFASNLLAEEMQKVLEQPLPPKARKALDALKARLKGPGLSLEQYGGWLREPEGLFYLRHKAPARLDGRRAVYTDDKGWHIPG